MSKDERLTELRRSVMEQIGMAASEVGGLDEAEYDRWWDEITEGVQDGLDSALNGEAA